MRSRLLALLAVPLLLPAPPVAAQALEADVMEWTVPWERTRPRDPYVAPDGRVWFVGQVGNYLAVLDPRSGEFERVEIDEGTHPHNQIIDAQGRVWYSGNQNGMIGRYDPVTKQITRYPMPDSTVRDPHTLIFDGKGNIYFTAQNAGIVGRLVMATGKIDLVRVGQRTRPYGMIADNQGRAWFTEFGTNKVAMIEPGSLALKEYTLPEGSRPRRIALGPNGTIWYVDYARGFLGRIDPVTSQVTEWASPSGAGANPYAMASDDAGRLWYVETGPRPNRLVGFDPTTSRFIVNQEVGVAGANTIRHMVFHAPTRTIWYGSDANMIGRVAVPPPSRRLVP